MRRLIQTTAIIFIAFILVSGGCDEKKNDKSSTENMKKATNFSSYEAEWKKVDSLDQKNLPKSALEIVNSIMDKASKEGNQMMQIKALVYQLKYADQLEENSFSTAIQKINHLQATNQEPLKQILASLKGEVISSYYQQNRWKLRGRSTTQNYDLGDITTWDLKTLADNAFKSYLSSLQNPSKLQSIDTKEFTYILTDTSKRSLELTPTIYDLLASRALLFFENDELNIERPVDKFSINDEAYFGTEAQFLKVNTDSKDSLSAYLHYSKVMQDLTRFHSNDKYPVARLTNHLNRLYFAHEKSTLSNKTELYEAALRQLMTDFSSSPNAADISYALAESLISRGSEAERGTKEFDLFKEAHQLATETIKRYPNSYGAQNAQSLINQLESKEIDGKVLEFNGTKASILALIEYRNIEKINVLIYKDDEKDKKEYFSYLKEKLKGKNLVSEKIITLPKASDFQKHSTEIALDQLPLGNYLIVYSTDGKLFNQDTHNHWIGEFQVTDLAYSTRKIDGNKSNILVQDRNSGAAIAGATVKISKWEYNYQTRESTRKLVQTVKTDGSGSADILIEDEMYNSIIEVSYGKDAINSRANFYKSRDDKSISFHDHLYTDRAIFRPGQTVYFKGLRIQTKDKKQSIAAGQKVKATLYDVNHQKVSEMDLTTNEYGSFTSSFKLPTTGLTGQMHITTNHGNVYFSVEEYKRPTFKVEFAKSKQEIKLGQKIEINGSAVAYAGNSVDAATVKYVIKRTLSLPYWRAWYYRIAPIASSSTIIAEGTVVTDKDGNFKVDFTPQKDAAQHVEGLNYNFEISADITDANGETRSATKQISIGATAINLIATIPSAIDIDAKNEVSIQTSNAEGESIPANGTITIFKLKSPTKVKVRRLWEAPTDPLLSASEFEKLFPFYDYKSVKEMDKEVEKNVASLLFNTANKSTVTLQTNNWSPGDYKMEVVTKDAQGKEEKSIQFFTVYSTKSTTVAPGQFLSVQSSKTTLEPGQILQIAVGSSLLNQLIWMEVGMEGKIIERRAITLNNEQKIINYKIEEKHRGGLHFSFSTIKAGDKKVVSIPVNVPYSNKELSVSFETFRNTLLPGEQEEWRLRISGPKKEKVAAELLLTMYDASLDAFRENNYHFAPYTASYYYDERSFVGFGLEYGTAHNPYAHSDGFRSRTYPNFNWFGYNMSSYGSGRMRSVMRTSEHIMSESVTLNLAPMEEVMLDETEMQGSGKAKREQTDASISLEKPKDIPSVRTNFNETAFFYPQLKTDSNGDVLVTFTAPESLTTWKILGLAHTKSLEYALISKELVTQKELMVQTNLPRFIRTNDIVTVTSKISNITNKELSGDAKIELYDANTMKDVTELYEVKKHTKSFTVNGKESTVVSWEICATDNSQALIVRVTAKAANHQDGEELTVPVITDKVLITESFPLTNNGKGSKDFEFSKLVNSKESSTLKHHAVTLEYTSNPAWYVVQALPYMMEYPYDCAEQIFTRFYANSIASNIVRSSPKMKQVFDQWSKSSPDAFLSNLEKNEQLKALILEETPWVLEANDQSERKKRVALLFDFNKMDNELAKNLSKLKEAQVSNGGFPWFPGMPESRYVTQYIVSGLGHLNQLNITSVKENRDIKKMTENAVKYLDDRMLEDYKELKKRNLLTKDYFVSQYLVQYIYARTFFNEIKLGKEKQEAFDFFKANAEKNWTKLNLNNQTMLALATHRLGNVQVAKDIMKSIVERSISTEEMGMYWKENERGYYWYQAPIETQSLIIEALYTIEKNQTAINNAKIWLLRNKQTSDWKTTTATANACYALLLGGSSFTDQSEQVKIEINGKEIKPADFGAQVEAGTGYFQTTWTGKEISSDLGKIKVSRQTEGFSWGAMYWQYFEAMDKVTSAETNLKLKKQLFVVRQTSSGEVIVPVNDSDKLKRGEKIRVRIELSTDRNMEFVHMKDYRAAGFEPINMLSSYKWKNGLGFYENTRDVATHFFFDYLPKGTHVFEYDLRVSHTGNFSNGFATIQCMYAPEFTSHSNGVRVIVE